MKSDMMQYGFLFLAGHAAALLVPHEIQERAACNRDNLFRCFIDQRYSIQASDFCLGLAPVTVTVATETATSTITVQTEVTHEEIFFTETSTTTVFTETIPTATTTVTAAAENIAKRQVNPPKCMTNGVTYPASRITSACSCINVPAETVSITHIVSTETVTDVLVSDVTPLVTVTEWTTISTATTGGVATVTVTPVAINPGDATGWQLDSNSWDTGAATDSDPKCQTKLIPLTPGSYTIDFITALAAFPAASNIFAVSTVIDMTNPSTDTVMTMSFKDAKRVVKNGKIIIYAGRTFQVTEAQAGNFKLCIRSPYWGYVQELAIRRA